MYLLSGCAEHTLGNLVDIVISSNCNSSSWNWNHQVMFNVVAFNIVSIWLVYHTDFFPIFNRLILERRFIRKYRIARQTGHTASFSVKSTRSSINLCRIRASIRPYSRLYEYNYLMRRMYGYLNRIYNIYTYVHGLALRRAYARTSLNCSRVYERQFIQIFTHVHRHLCGEYVSKLGCRLPSWKMYPTLVPKARGETLRRSRSCWISVSNFK